MKLLHIADLHIGKVVNGFPMIDDQKHALAGVLDAACRERVDALLMARRAPRRCPCSTGS